jgi:hypothetical protein
VAPSSPSSIATAAASALLRTAAAISGVMGGGVATQAGAATRPPYQPPYMAVAPSAASNSSIGIVTSQAITPCRMAGSARRIPGMRAATQPPTTKAKKAPPMLKIDVRIRTLRHVVDRGAVN